ncbi:MAG: cyclic nucleotide-binding domain-containing protein [Pseudonocardia sp.]|nr:cyclic nucleotide-binding domain-containing protein [Pseudonocardia sp.]
MSESANQAAPRDGHLTIEELRTLFLFADLTDTQVAWVAAHGDVVEAERGAVVVTEGEPATCFYVLLSGTISMSRLIGGDPVETTRTDQRGVYFGAVQFYLDDDMARDYAASVRALTDCVLLALPAKDFAKQFTLWYPMAVHLLEGMILGLQRNNAQVAERERLLALGKLSAGLTHELNNPAAAAGRAADTLRDKVAGMRAKLAMIADGRIAGDQLKKLVMAQDEFVKKVRHAPALSPMQAADAEDELGEWLEEHGIDGGWDLAPVFVAGGLGIDDLEAVAAAANETTLDGAIRWLAYTVETESLLREILDATSRISELVLAAKQYSQLDRAPHRLIDVHEGLDATVVMFGRKLGQDSGIGIVKQYDRTLPLVPGYPAELNQVWTNIIDNAIDAMGGHGTLTVRTALDEGRVLVEIGDTGPGIPAEVRQRIFEPFFTTKPVGQGTGLGLDVSYRVIVTRHHGDITVESQPGDTRFQVRLPIHETDLDCPTVGMR